MPWENNIDFFLFKCTEYRERVLKDNVKDDRKVGLIITSGTSKVSSGIIFQYDHFTHWQKTALTRMGSISSEKAGICSRQLFYVGTKHVAYGDLSK